MLDPARQRRLEAAFATLARAATPLGRALCAALGQGAAPAVTELFSQFYRTISAELPDAGLFMSAVHHLALTGAAPELAALFPTCGGAPDAGDLAAACAATITRERDSLLDYMLSGEARPQYVERSTAVLLGAMAAADRFGGGVSLVEFGCGAGFDLLFDKYAYRLGNLTVGHSDELTLPVAIDRFIGRAMPAVAGRYGLDSSPAAAEDRLLLESCFWPDEVERVAHLRAAAAIRERFGPLDIRTGAAEGGDLLPLLAEAYTAMEPGNTLLVIDSFVWPYYSDPERQQITWQIQRLASGLQPHKPLAWLQAEPFGGGAQAELRLHTFGWADPEDRAVRRLAEANHDFSRVKWLE
jgi:hypothetical protein